ncbi:MAG: rhodanese-like domain-containing protein [Desulfobacterales bacterium]
MSKYRLTKYLLMMVAATLLSIPGPLAAAEDATVTGISKELIKGAAIEADYSLAVTAAELLNKTKQNRRMTLVDVRSPDEFDRLRIPGSISVPLHAVKTKDYLKAQPFVLVSAGYEWRDLETECKRLQQSGFKPSILFGGLVAWQNQGGPVEGDRLLVAAYKEISTHLFFYEKDYKDIKVFDVSTKPIPYIQKLIPGTVHVKNIESLLRLLKQNSPTYLTLVLFNESGEQYEKFDAALKKAGIPTAFYLKGGISGYRHFLENTTLSWKSKAERVVTLGGCGSCGRVCFEEGQTERLRVAE